jgi:hypothetical protein
VKYLSLLAGVVLAGSVASAASATTLIIKDVETGNGSLGNVSVQGWGTPWTTPILMTDSNNVVHVVFCDDLNHDVYVGGGQSLAYVTGFVTVDGAGNPLTEAVSNEMGQLASIGQYDYAHGNENGAIAAQAAIWGLEYNILVSSTDSSIETQILQDLTIHDNGRGFARGIISQVGTQSQITGGVPEPSTWALMLMGVGMLGLSLRKQARAIRGRVQSAMA